MNSRVLSSSCSPLFLATCYTAKSFCPWNCRSPRIFHSQQILEHLCLYCTLAEMIFPRERRAVNHCALAPKFFLQPPDATEPAFGSSRVPSWSSCCDSQVWLPRKQGSQAHASSWMHNKDLQSHSPILTQIYHHICMLGLNFVVILKVLNCFS